MTGQVHFLLTGGPLTWQYERAIKTAKVHSGGYTGIVLWYTGLRPDVPCPFRRLGVPAWLENEHPQTLYDVLALQVLYHHGGMALALDSISLRSAWDLLPDGHELVVAEDYPDTDVAEHPYNNLMIARHESPIVGLMLEEAQRRVRAGEIATKGRGVTGPQLLTPFVRDNPGRVAVAPYPTMCGWSCDRIWRFYEGREEPSPEVRVVHLFSSGHPGQYATFRYPKESP